MKVAKHNTVSHINLVESQTLAITNVVILSPQCKIQMDFETRRVLQLTQTRHSSRGDYTVLGLLITAVTYLHHSNHGISICFYQLEHNIEDMYGILGLHSSHSKIPHLQQRLQNSPVSLIISSNQTY